MPKQYDLDALDGGRKLKVSQILLVSAVPSAYFEPQLLDNGEYLFLIVHVSRRRQRPSLSVLEPRCLKGHDRGHVLSQSRADWQKMDPFLPEGHW